MSIESAILEAILFIEAVEDDAATDNQADQLMQLIATIPCSKADVTNAVKLLKSKRGRAAFSSGHLKMLSQSLSKVGSEIRICAGGQSKKVIHYSAGQDHVYFVRYMALGVGRTATSLTKAKSMSSS